MTKQEKRRFIRELFTTIQKELVGKVNQMPEEWNGIELRQLAADKFAESTILKRHDLRRRFNEYRHAVIIRNL